MTNAHTETEMGRSDGTLPTTLAHDPATGAISTNGDWFRYFDYAANTSDTSRSIEGLIAPANLKAAAIDPNPYHGDY